MRFPAICRFTSIRRFPAICRLGMHVAFAKLVVLPKCISMAEMEAVEAAEVEGEVVEIGAEIAPMVMLEIAKTKVSEIAQMESTQSVKYGAENNTK